MESKENLMTAQEVAFVTGMHIDTVRRWDKEGLLVARRTPGGHRRYRAEDVYAFEQTSMRFRFVLRSTDWLFSQVIEVNPSNRLVLLKLSDAKNLIFGKWLYDRNVSMSAMKFCITDVHGENLGTDAMPCYNVSGETEPCITFYTKNELASLTESGRVGWGSSSGIWEINDPTIFYGLPARRIKAVIEEIWKRPRSSVEEPEYIHVVIDDDLYDMI